MVLRLYFNDALKFLKSILLFPFIFSKVLNFQPGSALCFSPFKLFTMTQEELQQLAGQLRQPSGSYGISVSEMMHESNIGMTRHAISRLHLSAHERVLELGHGNGAHIPYIMEQAEDLLYSGLELSELMHAEAQRINHSLLQRAAFSLYDGTRFPFPENFFDKAFTVNTVYFWKQPLDTLNECYRVLKPGGRCCITFGEASFMQQLPFTQFGFTLYSSDSLSALVADTAFTLADRESQTELIKSKTGESVERTFTTLSLRK